MLVSFLICMGILLTSDSALAQTSYRTLMSISIIMMMLDAFDKALQLQHMLDAFVYYKGPGGPLAELSDTSYWVNSLKTLVYATQTWIGDGVLVRRILHQQRWMFSNQYKSKTDLKMLYGV